MSVPTHSFCWHGISSPVEAGTPFYTGALGWQVVDSPSGPMFVAPGGAVAHIQAPEGPPAWCSFLAVDDVDRSTARAVAEGGGLVVPPTDLPVGRFSVVATPSGGVFGLYQPTAEDVLPAPGPGTVHWVELHSTDVDADLAWFAAVFGFTARAMTMVAGLYHVLMADGVSRGGVMASREARSAFLAWVRVEDLDASLGRVEAAGGRGVTAPFSDPAVGRMAVVADPGGATFGLLQLP